MLKKIKDLTKEEMEKICNNHYDVYKHCAGCPLFLAEKFFEMFCLRDAGVKDTLEEEIEIEPFNREES